MFAFEFNLFVEGNLGIRGMALFFSTHECNPICARLNLTPFDLSAGERERQLQQHSLNMSAQTTCRGSEEPLNGLSKFGSLLRRLRSQSSVSEDESDGYASEASSITKIQMPIVSASVSMMTTPSPVSTFLNCMKIVFV